MQKTAIVVCLLTCSSLLWAKPKHKTYLAQPAQLFNAALMVARTHHVVTYVDRRDLTFTFETGGSLFTTGFVCNAFITPKGRNHAVLNLNVQKKNGATFAWGAGGRLANNFFKWVRNALISGNYPHPAPAATPAPALNTVAPSQSIAGAPPANTARPLTDADIIALSKAGLPPGVILAKIHNSPDDFNTGVKALIQLKKAGVSDSVIQAMTMAK